MKKLALVFLIVILAGGWAISSSGQQNPQGPPYISSSKAAYKPLGTVENIPIYKNVGKTTLLVFWASWCMPCLQEVPQLNHLHSLYGAAGLNILAMNMDESSDENVALLVKKFEIIYPVAIPTPELVRDFKVHAIPLTLLYGPSGMLEQSWLGPVSVEELERQIKKVLPAKPEADKGKS